MRDVLDRLQSVLGLKTDAAVAEALRMERTALEKHKSRGSLPFPQLVHFCLEHSLSIDWLLTGKGEKTSTPTCPLSPDQRLPPKGVCDLMQKTLDVLTSGYSSTIEALEKNINEFHDTIRLRRLAGEKPDKPHPLGEPEARASAGQTEPEKKAM